VPSDDVVQAYADLLRIKILIRDKQTAALNDWISHNQSIPPHQSAKLKLAMHEANFCELLSQPHGETLVVSYAKERLRPLASTFEAGSFFSNFSGRTQR
jgi:glutamate mutase epsilon subunit